MPRASQYLTAGHTYHLTHRCTNREFFLRFAKDRNLYREWLRIGAERHEVPVYGYCVTSSHVHIIVHVDDAESVGMLMDLVAGVTAQQYNRRKKRTGAFWEPYQCTIVQDGRHLFNCLRYVDLNMVRAGAVEHPGDWRWCSWSELMGQRLSYRILDTDRLLQSLDINDLEAFRKSYQEAVQEHLDARQLGREAQWTESLAVGTQAFVLKTARQIRHRYRFTYEESLNDPGHDTWHVREASEPYIAVSPSKTEPRPS